MLLLIKETTILDPESPHNGQTTDILIENGSITQIGNNLSEANAEIIDAKGTYTSPGFADMRAQFADPGLEQREDIKSGSQAAAAGGFTEVALLPSTNPPIHSKSEVEYIINKANRQVTSVFPMGCITHNREGKEISEMYDMHTAGAIAFTDGNRAISDSGLMHRAMLYAKGFNGLLCVHAQDAGLSLGGQMNEGEMAVHLGMKGIPNLAEQIMVKRDIELAKYNDAKIHFSHISTAEAVELIRQAKKEGHEITADVAIANLIWDDTALEEYDTNYKVTPPLRTKTDRQALIEGLKDGTIDAICSDHNPQEAESKVVEFEYAENGMIGLQTFLPLLLQLQGTIGWDTLIYAIAHKPRNIFGLADSSIVQNSTANLCIFNPALTWEFNKTHNYSKSANSPLFGQTLTGKVIATLNNNKIARFE